MDLPVTPAFTRALPKVELHAHLTGSISPQCLHEIWKHKPNGLADPLIACKPEGAHHDIFSFFKIFDTYIYSLVNDHVAVSFATRRMLEEFAADGVRYLELRTTPREAGMSKAEYVETVLEVIDNFGREKVSTYLILSIDRRNTVEQAMEVVELALRFKDRGVVGVDLCGNPMKGDVSIFREAFARAKESGLKVTIHFAEVPESSTEDELSTLLSYEPHRIGHVINVSSEIETVIEQRQIGLELCLSCNVHAKMIKGGFGDHHFGKWYGRSCPIALCTDDFGVFGSTVSNEYLLAAEHFNLSRSDLIKLSGRAVLMIFGSKDDRVRLNVLLDEFAKSSTVLIP